MNLVNLMKQKRECGALLKNMRVIFYFYGYKSAFLGSQRFIRFINITIRMLLCEFVRQIINTPYYFMNLMNVYEVMVLKENFENVAVMVRKFMKWKCSKSSFCFINFLEFDDWRLL
jgi:hypothetical protein